MEQRRGNRKSTSARREVALVADERTLDAVIQALESSLDSCDVELRRIEELLERLRTAAEASAAQVIDLRDEPNDAPPGRSVRGWWEHLHHRQDA